MDNVWFSNTVHSAFKFLTLEHGFSSPRVTCAAGTLEPFPPNPDPSFHYASVIYEKGDHFVEAAHGTHGVEFELVLGFCSYSHVAKGAYPWAYLEYLLDIVAPDYRFPPRGVITSLEQKFSFFIRETAKALRLHGKRFFENDQSLWIDIDNLKRQRIEEQRLCEERRQINRENQRLRQEAKNAFENSQWELTVASYRAITDDLSKSEEKRLLIAEKRLANERPGLG